MNGASITIFEIHPLNIGWSEALRTIQYNYPMIDNHRELNHSRLECINY